jgi:hypothetical protein
MLYRDMAPDEQVQLGDEYEDRGEYSDSWKLSAAWKADGRQNPAYRYRRPLESTTEIRIVTPPKPAEHIDIQFPLTTAGRDMSYSAYNEKVIQEMVRLQNQPFALDDTVIKRAEDVGPALAALAPTAPLKMAWHDVILDIRKQLITALDRLRDIETLYINLKSEQGPELARLKDDYRRVVSLGDKCSDELAMVRERCVKLEMEVQSYRRRLGIGTQTREQAAADMKKEGL